MHPPLLFIEGVAPLGQAFFHLPLWREYGRAIRVYDLDAQCLEGVQAVLVAGHVDQRALQARQSLLDHYLQQGGSMVINGHVAYPFLPMLRPFVPLAERNMAGLQVQRLMEHPVFRGVDTYDLTYRRGVAGFYGRGHNPLPPGAKAIHGIGPQALPLDWELPLAGAGRLLVHGGNDLWMYAADNTSARRIAPQLLEWLLEGVTV
ncbi:MULTISPECIES: hypothetical protein [Giesbergeria]|uniref:Uncharacterized protein n=1 Tax=Giesbergeria sinuosa TaxID=80883 RepID=A0ABV9QHH2_9BURK